MANVELSAAELELVTNSHFILTKNGIIAKVYGMFGVLAESYSREVTKRNLPVNVLKASPKISKGENYMGLPWVMLDYPRCFSKQDILAVRTFFWWGNFCSITLQLKGNYQTLIDIPLLDNTCNDWFLCCNEEDEWQHHFGPQNYRLLSSFSMDEIRSLPFIKLAKKIPLQEWDRIDSFIHEAFHQMMHALAS